METFLRSAAHKGFHSNIMAKVKICGITNLEDALACVIAGCDALGFVFYRKSPRYIAPEKARNLSRIIPRPILKVGVFVNAKEETVKHIARFCKLDMLQFHGDEPWEFCKKFRGYRIIKAFRVKDRINLKNILGYRTFGYLFDTFVPSRIGGTGESFDWGLIRGIRKNIKQAVFLSGGLNKNNVKKAIELLHPDWVDASSSLEMRSGKKDKKKIKEFIEAVK